MTTIRAPCNLRPSSFRGPQCLNRRQNFLQAYFTLLKRSLSDILRLRRGTLSFSPVARRSFAPSRTVTLLRVASAAVRRPPSSSNSSIEVGLVEAQTDGQKMAGADEIAAQEHPLVYVSFYKFASLPDYEQLRLKIKQKCDEQGVAGGIIVAPEGINGSICGTRAGVDSVLAYLRSDLRFATMRNTEGPGPAEASPAASRPEDTSRGNGWVGPGGEEWKATPFQRDRVNVKVKKEVIPLGVEVDPTREVGTYVKPEDWNALLEDPDVIVVDVRNEYETRIGKFRGAVDPRTVSFKDFPGWVEKHLVEGGAGESDRASSGRAASTAGRESNEESGHSDADSGSEPNGISHAGEVLLARSGLDGNNCVDDYWGTRSEARNERESTSMGAESRELVKMEAKAGTREQWTGEPDGRSGEGDQLAKSKKIAMYCTGGIRCEKSTSLLLQMGFKEVYHLEGGILRYLDETPAEESLWEGECFVFDRRTSVTHGMEPGSYSLCFACKEPISPEQKASPLFITGIQCPLCAHKKTEKQKERDRQRQMQFERHGLIGGKLKTKPPKRAAVGTKRGAEEAGRVGTWVTGGDSNSTPLEPSRTEALR